MEKLSLKKSFDFEKELRMVVKQPFFDPISVATSSQQETLWDSYFSLCCTIVLIF